MTALGIRLTNAAGMVKQPRMLEKLCTVPVLDGIVVGSFTVKPREGNTGGTNFFVLPDGTSVNSLGLPNPGIDQLVEWLPFLLEATNSAGKDLIVSVAGEDANEFELLVRMIKDFPVIIELNFGCPNRLEDGKHLGIIAYQPWAMKPILERIMVIYPRREYRVKLSPYADPMQRESIAGLIKGFPIKAVVTCNTFPNVRLRKGDRSTHLGVAGGRGGMAGKGLHHIAVANAEHFRELLPDDVDVIGVGGIFDGWTLREFEMARCSEVQIGTAFMHDENPRAFETIVADYLEDWGGMKPVDAAVSLAQRTAEDYQPTGIIAKRKEK